MFYYSRTPLNTNRGIYTKVFKRAVGNPEYFNISKWRLSVGKRLIGIINCDALDTTISFDRTRFRDDDPLFKKYQKFIWSKIAEIGYNIKQEEEVKKFEEYTQHIRTEVTKLEEKINILMSSLFPEQEKLQIQLSQPKSVQGMKTRSIGYLDHETNTMYINSTHPLLNNTFVPPAVVEVYLATTAFQLLSNSILASQRPALKRIFDNTYGVQFDMAIDFYGELKDQTAPSISISGFRLYQLSEISHLAKISRRTLNRLVESGVLECYSPHSDKFKGDAALKCIKQLKNRVALTDIIAEIAPSTSFSNRLSTVENQLAQTVIRYVENIGVSSPFYIVAEADVVNFKKLLLSGRIDLRRADGAGCDYLSLFGFETDYGISPEKVMWAIDAAKKNGTPINQIFDEKLNDFRYNSGGVLQVLEKRNGQP